MLSIKDNFSLQNDHIVITELTVNNRYEFESVVLHKGFTNTKLTCTPLIMRDVYTNKSTVSARFICILSIKRISKEVIKQKGLKVCLHVH